MLETLGSTSSHLFDYLCIAVIKHMSKARSRKKGLFGAYSSGGTEEHPHHGGEHDSRQACIALEQHLRIPILTHKQDAES